MHDLTNIHRDLLVVIAGLDDPSGQEIKHELVAYYGDDVNVGNLYGNLNRLVRKGLLEKGAIDGRTNYYRLTRRGRRELEDRVQWEREQRPAPETTPVAAASGTD